jgi:hypothetical protein
MLVTPILDHRDENSVLITMLIVLFITFVGVLLTLITPIKYMRTEFLNHEKSNLSSAQLQSSIDN